MFHRLSKHLEFRQKILRGASYFELHVSSRCLDILMKHCLSCLVYINCIAFSFSTPLYILAYKCGHPLLVGFHLITMIHKWRELNFTLRLHVHKRIKKQPTWPRRTASRCTAVPCTVYFSSQRIATPNLWGVLSNKRIWFSCFKIMATPLFNEKPCLLCWYLAISSH